MMIIVSAADERFVPHFATLLHSVWTHQPNAQVHLLDCGIAPATLATLANFASGLGIALAIIHIDTAPFADLPTDKLLSAATYARLLIPDIFPSAERALYLDADCVVVGDLTDLWHTDLGEAAIGGVYDYGLVMERRAGIVLSTYVNAGVLLMNLPVWRRGRLSAAATALIKQHQPQFRDQTGINAACAGRTCYLHERWNFLLGAGHSVGDWVGPRIIHCTGAAKPWLHRDAFLGELYRYHRRQTPFPLAEPRAVYRSKARFLWDLLIGRRRYWYRFLIGRRARAFVEAYLTARSVQPDRGVAPSNRQARAATATKAS
jgi:UDP-glucose:(glucosyl)LPS alpha-1,3-glucosyltransferase/UDP-D-galactose:(glucosyl)LPS alpha-1,3-D-galactosyltransferase/UDP-glucose:(galactosyl)LPS alpha-1,2-glucosyltransferase